MTEHSARELTKRIQRGADNLRDLLLEAHDGGAWKALGYTAWSKYLTEEFDVNPGHAGRLLIQARSRRQLAELTGVPEPEIPLSARAASELGAEGVAAVGEAAMAKAEEQGVAESPLEKVRLLREETMNARQKIEEERLAKETEELAAQPEDARARAVEPEPEEEEGEEIVEGEVVEEYAEDQPTYPEFVSPDWATRPTQDRLDQAATVFQQILLMPPDVVAQTYLGIPDDRKRVPVETMARHLLTWAHNFVAELGARADGR